MTLKPMGLADTQSKSNIAVAAIANGFWGLGKCRLFEFSRGLCISPVALGDGEDTLQVDRLVRCLVRKRSAIRYGRICRVGTLKGIG